MSNEERDTIISSLRKLTDKIDAQAELVTALRLELAELRTRLEMRRECPDPGACLRVADSLRATDERVDELERLADRGRGAWWAVGALASLAAALGGLAGALWQKLFQS